jgi:hypothetical protein
MPKELGPMDVCCDAPPYEVVRACRNLGLRAPEDVRWLRMSVYCAQPLGHAPGVVSWFRRLFKPDSTQRSCTCGRILPELGIVAVTFADGDQATYVLGQCARCDTVFWDMA